MTRAQRFHLLIDVPGRNVSLWTQVCNALGWDKGDRAKRLEVFSAALGRPVTSSGEIGNVEDFTRLKGHLLALARPADLNAQLRQEAMPRTNLRVRIGEFDPGLVKHLLKQRFTWPVWLRRNHPGLEGATISRTSRRPAPEAIVAEYREAGPSAPALEDLNEVELQQLRNTLAREENHRNAGATEAEPSADPDWSVG